MILSIIFLFICLREQPLQIFKDLVFYCLRSVALPYDPEHHGYVQKVESLGGLVVLDRRLFAMIKTNIMYVISKSHLY